MEVLTLLAIALVLIGLAVWRTESFDGRHPNAELIVHLLNNCCSARDDQAGVSLTSEEEKPL